MHVTINRDFQVFDVFEYPRRTNVQRFVAIPHLPVDSERLRVRGELLAFKFQLIISLEPLVLPQVLDLTDPTTFRDLSKPMGAQTPDRLEQFLKRYREWDDPTGETPPYMYGTHYSSAMIIVSYLVRLEPFTQQFLKLQVR